MMSNYLTVCSICLGSNNKRIVKEHPEVYEEVFSTVREFNKKTRQFEKITKKVMRLKIFDDEPHETETIENSNFQYLEDGFVVEELFPICSKVLNTVMTHHYGHYSCIRDLVIAKDSDYNITKCPQCRDYILDDVYDTIKQGPNYQEKRKKISEKNKNIKKFDDSIVQRHLRYRYKGGSMLSEDEIVKMIYNADSVPIPLYGITKDHALFLYNGGFVFTRFAVSKKYGKKIDDYSVSIPRLLFWEQRSYDTSIKAISNNIVNGSGIDKEVADAIATISYQNNDNNGSVHFEIGRYGGMDFSYYQLEIFDTQRKAKKRRQERIMEENELQLFQDIEGLCISELLFGQHSTNDPSSKFIFKMLTKAVNNFDMEKYIMYKRHSLYGGVLLRVSMTRPDCNPWLKRLKKCENKIFYYVVLIDLMMNVMITGRSKNIATELCASARYADTLINKVLGKISNDLDINQFKKLVPIVDFMSYVNFAEKNNDDTVLNSVKVVKYVYEKVLYYGDNIGMEACLNIEEYQRCLHTIATNPDGIVNSVPLVPLYINSMILKCFVNEDDEEKDEERRAFLQLIQLILEYCLTGKGIKKIKLFIKNNSESLHTMMLKLNVDVFADLIIKGQQDFDNVKRLAMTYDFRCALKK
jgi:hypothetical protein